MKRKRKFESLESRIVLHSAGLSAYMTLSFVPDGTVVSSEESVLYDTFSKVADHEVWEAAIQNAFNSWAIHTNADIGVVEDLGDAMGTMGLRQSDDRFGDIRIAAIPLAPSVYAISFPRDNVSIGTWAADIIFNSEADWNSVDDIAAVALHEAGHIYGLEHSDDHDSVMHQHGRSIITTLSEADIAAIQKLYGVRRPDANEGQDGNDSWGSASDFTDVLLNEQLLAGYADISEIGDVDVYRLDFDIPAEEDLALWIQTDGLSLLDPTVSFFTADEQLIFSTQGADGVVVVDQEALLEAHYFSVEASESGFGIGRYSFAIAANDGVFEGEKFTDFAAGDFFGFEGLDLPEFLEFDDPFFYVEEDHLRDEFLDAREIEVIPHGEHSFLEAVGSISAPIDSDVFTFLPADIIFASGDAFPVPGIGTPPWPIDPSTPDFLDPKLHQSTMTVIVQSLKRETLNPKVSVINEFGEKLAHKVIVNGNGEVIVQADLVDPFIYHFVNVEAADAEDQFAVGNYKVSVEFETPSIELTEYTRGELSAATPLQMETLYVATPQLFHLLLEVDSEGTETSAEVLLEVFGASGQVVYTITTKSGESRSAANPLLQPGTYHVRVSAQDSIQEGVSLSYKLHGLTVSNPLGVLPSDPAKRPTFQCDGVTEQFCYPGGQTSNQPFFWDKFIRDYLNGKQQEGTASPAKDPTLNWWDWYQELQQQAKPNELPDANVDSYRVLNSKLYVSAAQGVLRNDSSAHSSHLIATVARAPAHGILNFKSDGSFTYIPNDDFLGSDSFTYQAYDIVNASNPVQVSVHISTPGDVNDDQQIDFADFLVMAANFLMQDAGWEDGDFTGDGVVDFGDFLLFSHHYASTS